MNCKSIVALTLLLALLASVSTACECGYGSEITSPTPGKCLCSCDAGYTRPQCLYKVNNTAPIHIMFNLTGVQYVSTERLLTIIRNGLSLNTAEVTIIFKESSGSGIAAANPGLTVYRIAMVSDKQQPLIDAVEANVLWTQQANISKVAPIPVEPAPRHHRGESGLLYDGNDMRVYVSDMGWLLGVLLLLALVPFVECLWQSLMCLKPKDYYTNDCSDCSANEPAADHEMAAKEEKKPAGDV